MKKIFISVIVPVFNVEKYIGDCINSLISQIFQDFEVVLIDDCGGDNSISIACSLLQQTNVQFQVVRQESNKGVSSARNAGVANAKGDYIAFLDSDDMVNKYWLENLYNMLQIKKVDLIQFRWKVYENKEEITRELEEDSIIVDKNYIKGMRYLENYLNHHGEGAVWMFLFSKELLIDNPFNEHISIHEDLLLLAKVISNANTVLRIPNEYYMYRRTPFSLTNGGAKVESYAEMPKELEKIQSYILQRHPSLLWNTIRFKFHFLRNTSLEFCNKSITVEHKLLLIKEWSRYMRPKEIWDVIKSKENTKLKLMIFMFKYFPTMYFKKINNTK